MENYPLILDGKEIGTVCVHGEGGWTLFDACGETVPGIVRISVYGGGKEGYLGVLAPEDGGLALHRRFSRNAMRGFPEPIEYAGRAGQPHSAAQPEPAQEPVRQETEPAAVEPGPDVPQQTKQDETTPDAEDLCWYASPDGALVCFDGAENLIALPAGDKRIPDGAGGLTRSIEGREYIVYRTRDGRLKR